MNIMAIIFGLIRKNKLTMKYIKKFEMWTTDVTDKTVSVNYNDKKPKLSDVVIDIIKFIN